VDGQPVPKVIDFGIAKATHQRLTEKTLYTSHRQIIGTPQYMSPEQAESSDLDIDTRSDIYSLGVLLYELLTSTTPFLSNELHRMGYDEICHTIRYSDPPTPSRRMNTLGDSAADIAKNRQIDPAGLRKLLKGDLDWIVMKCLEKDRAHRYDTANAVALDIQRHLTGEPIQARRTSRVERVWRWSKRNRMTAALSLTVAALMTFVAITAPLFAWRQSRLVEETRQQVYAKDMAIAFNVWNDSDLGHLSELLNRYATGARFERFRDFPWYYLNGLYQRATTGFETGNRFDVSLSKNLVAVGKPDHQIHLYDLKTWNEVGTIPWDYPPQAALRFSPDGNFLAAAHEKGTVTVCDVASCTNLYTIPVGSPAVALYFPVFSAEGSILATGGPDDVVKIWKATTGELLRELPHRGYVSVLAFSPDGKTLATGSFDGTLRLWDTDAWKAIVIEGAHNGRIYALAYDSSGNLALGGWGDDVSIWDPSGKRLESLPIPGAGSICFSPDGRLLAVGGDQQGIVHVWNCQDKKLVTESPVGHISATIAFLSNNELLIESDDKLRRRVLSDRMELVAGHTNRQRTVRVAIDISPAGDSMVASYGPYAADAGEGAVVYWDLRRGTHRALPGLDDSSVFDAAIDRTGRLIAAGGRSSRGAGFVKLWDAQTGRKIADLTEETFVDGVAISPAGDLLAVGSAGSVSVWQIRDGQLEFEWRKKTNGWARVAFSPRGDVVAVACDRADGINPSVTILDASTGEQLKIVAYDRFIMELAFSPDSRLLASIENNGKVQVFDRRLQRT
ncbi:MAG TPA: protein kinase, partial [Lacipirellulaceae bacterium]|nr:protein kinase [Lacipirellulaceae bacterium]